mgnify:CR=1 FL=1
MDRLGDGVVDPARVANDIMIQAHIRPFLGAAQKVAWAALLFTLPVTSFPYFPPALGGDALVRPLAVYPLILLGVLAVLPALFIRPVSRTVLTLLPFVLIALVSSLASLLRGIEPALGISVEARVLRGVITLAIGCAFYVTIATFPQTRQDLDFSLRWIYAGGLAALFWGSLQAAGIFFSSQSLFAFLEKAQTYISIRPLRPDRISGLTYEPHWFAEQMILLLLPWTLAAALNGYSVYRWRWRWLSVEWLIVGWCILLLPFTYSRAGLLNLAILVFLSVIFFRPSKNNHLPNEVVKQNAARRLAGWGKRRLVEAVIVLGIVLIPIYLIGDRNPFFARIWGYWKQPQASLSGYLSYLGFDARLVYGQAAFNTYLAYPVLGVGLGNYAFYFEEMLPYRPIAEVPEVLHMVTPEPGRDRLITSKNLYLRLLAETGIVGATAYLAFVIAHVGCAIYLWLSIDRRWQYWGTASLCGLLAFALSAMTFDSFVIPNTWVVFGLICAATRVMMQPLSSHGETE